eukprot:7161233-Prymnesium_polylepis.1
MMRRASITAVARHDAFGCVLTRCGWAIRAARRRATAAGNRTRPGFCAARLFLVFDLSCHPLKKRGGGRPAADL